MLSAYQVISITKEVISVGASFQRWAVPLMILSMPEIMSIILPMASVLGGLLGTRSLSESSEIVVAQGLGIGIKTLIKPWGILSICLLVLSLVNMHILVPKAYKLQKTIQLKMLEEARIRFLRPGAKPWLIPGSLKNAAWIAPNGHMHFMEISNDKILHLVANNIKLKLTDEINDNSHFNKFELFNVIIEMNDVKGSILNKFDDKVTLVQEEQHNYVTSIPSVIPRWLSTTNAHIKATTQLIREYSPESTIELIRRISLPIATCTLFLLGIALGISHPRFLKGGSIGKSIVIIVTYYLINKYFENQILFSTTTNGNSKNIFPKFILLTLPIYYLLFSLIILVKKLRPRRSNIYSYYYKSYYKKYWFEWIYSKMAYNKILLSLIKAKARCSLWSNFHNKNKNLMMKIYDFLIRNKKKNKHYYLQKNILTSWTNNLWWKNWCSIVGTFLLLSFLVEYVTLAGKLSYSHTSMLTFIRYWLWNLPEFTSTIFSITFLLTIVLIFSQVSASQEWMAICASGVGLLKWFQSGVKSWGSVLIFTFIVQAFLSPIASKKSKLLYRQITGRQNNVNPLREKSNDWLYLGSTGVLWFLDNNLRWGFPLNNMNRPILLKWTLHDKYSQILMPDTFDLIPGSDVKSLFPDKALQESTSAEETPTLDLFQWQKWAPDAERTTMMWNRLLNFLGGPCLVFGILSSIIPAPRKSSTNAFGYSLVIGLIFICLQVVFSGAAKVGDIPPFWSVASPMFILLGLGFINMRKIKT